MKVIKYTIGIVVILIIGFELGWFFNDMNDFAKGVQEDAKRNTHLYEQSNDSVISAEWSKTEEIKDKYDINDLNGVYEYVYENNTEDLVKNHYLEFRNNEVYYYGTSDDFDESKEGYYPDFFAARVEDLERDENIISFNLKVGNFFFYKQPITPLLKTNGNEPREIEIRIYSRSYQGKINGDTITINTKGFDPRKFIKKKVANT
tara:strand:- start:33 stop:644 length:612 start_codon:yes stop_codon:yes gene_type:complete